MLLSKFDSFVLTACSSRKNSRQGYQTQRSWIFDWKFAQYGWRISWAPYLLRSGTTSLVVQGFRASRGNTSSLRIR